MCIDFMLMAICQHFRASMGGNCLPQWHKELLVHLITQAGGSKYELSQFNYRLEGMCVQDVLGARQGDFWIHEGTLTAFT